MELEDKNTSGYMAQETHPPQTHDSTTANMVRAASCLVYFYKNLAKTMMHVTSDNDCNIVIPFCLN